MSDKPYLEKVYKLKANPFESRTDPTAPMAGRQNEKELWTKAINNRKGGRANAIHFIVGDYGMGKTLTLHKILEQYKNDPEVLPVFMKMLPEDRIGKFGVDFIQRIFRSVPDNLLRQLSETVFNNLKSTFPEPAKIFLNISLNHVESMLFIRGEGSTTATQLSRLGVHRKIDSTHIAKEYLLSFLFLLKSIGINTLLLAVDEVEYVFSQMRGANISMVFNTLRDLYDILDSPEGRPLDLANIIFFLGISAAGWSRLNDLSQREQTEGGPLQPLMRRFGEIIELDPLDKSETKDLIAMRLSQNRITGEFEDQPLIPYDESFVEYVTKLSLGNPGEIVKYCDYALEEGLRQRAKLLDKEFAEQAFIAHGVNF